MASTATTGYRVSSRMKVGIVVPYSWSFWGAVVEHAELQAEALRGHGVETRTIIGNDPPGSFTRVLTPPWAPRSSAAGHHSGGPLGDRARERNAPEHRPLTSNAPAHRRALARERFDVLHVHEPMTPAIAVAAVALACRPMVGTFHAHGKLGWMKGGTPLWGIPRERLDHRIAVSPHARDTAAAGLPGEYEVVPNGVLIPPEANARDREQQVVFAGRQEPRKDLQVA